jgi:hypothetical protein
MISSGCSSGRRVEDPVSPRPSTRQPPKQPQPFLAEIKSHDEILQHPTPEQQLLRIFVEHHHRPLKSIGAESEVLGEPPLARAEGTRRLVP